MSSQVTAMRIISNGLFNNFLFRWAGGGPNASTPNLEDQVIFDQGFLPLALDTPISNCKAAALVLFRPGYFISRYPPYFISPVHSIFHFPGTLHILFPRYPPYLVSIPHSATRGGARWKTSNSWRDVINHKKNSPNNNSKLFCFLQKYLAIGIKSLL
jgi:hypothetical protein